jgi:hypothetical protein
MKISNPEAFLFAIIAIAVAVCIASAGIKFGRESVNEEWKERTQQAGFNLVTRYDQFTGEARLVLIPASSVEVKR